MGLIPKQIMSNSGPSLVFSFGAIGLFDRRQIRAKPFRVPVEGCKQTLFGCGETDLHGMQAKSFLLQRSQ